MSDYVESRWETKGEPTTTAYGANQSGFNEFGHRLPPKPVHNLHGISGIGRQSVHPRSIMELVTDFHRVTGTLPTRLLVKGLKQGDKYNGVMVPSLGYIGLDVEYGADETHVE